MMSSKIHILLFVMISVVSVATGETSDSSFWDIVLGDYASYVYYAKKAFKASTYVTGAVGGTAAALQSGVFQRNVEICITNKLKHHTLVNPGITREYGVTESNPEFSIREGKTVCTRFRGTRMGTAGTTGTLSYEIEGTDVSLAVIWNVPFWKNIFTTGNSFGLKVFETSGVAPDSTLLKFIPGKWHTHTDLSLEPKSGKRIAIKGSITDGTDAKLDVIVE